MAIKAFAVHYSLHLTYSCQRLVFLKIELIDLWVFKPQTDDQLFF